MRTRRHPRPLRTPDSGLIPAEWVGGRLTPPFIVMDRAEPYRPPLVVWMELPAGLIVGQEIVAPEDAAGALGRALRVAMDAPMVGPPRRPARIRVADRALADEVRAVVRDDVPIVVAPTPELDDLLESLIEMSSDGADARASYLEGGRIAPESVRRLFVAAELLWTAAPWKVAYDNQVLRMDVPALGVDGACVSIIGNLGEAFGLLIFPSLEAFEGFGDAAERIDRRKRRVDLRTSWIALNFERGGDIPLSMRREIATHGWPVEAPDAHPVVTHHDRDGALRPLSPRDVDVVRACASSLTAFFEKHRDLFGRDDEDFEPVCESWFDADDLEVRFTVPYEAFELFDLDEPPAEPAPTVRAKVGRNDPCPCGSGRKYKKCHLAADEKERIDAAPPEGIEGRLARTLARFAATRFGKDWNRSIDDFTDPTATLELAVPWSLYGAAVEGRRVVDWYLDEHGSRIPVQERSWLEAHRAAWLSVWEVTAVDRGVGMTLRDLLSDEVRVVVERSASQTLVERDAILARVVGREDAAVLCGVHPRALPPVDAAEVVRLARGRLRRKTAVPPERLRDAELGRYLIRQWEWAVEDLDVRSQLPPDLRNTDGNPLLLTIDHFAVADDAREAVEAALAGLDGIQPPEPGDDPPAYSFVRDGDPGNPLLETVLVGRAWLTATGLRVETNSIERADALRARIEVACGDRIRHRIREHADPMSSKVPRGAPPPPPPPEVQEALLEMQRRYYAAWLDESIPALGGQTPREAARTASGRRMLDTLLKDMENRERRGEGGFDFSGIRRELRLE